jgi:hypothetical protein
MKLDLDTSCVQNGLNLPSNPTLGFLLPIMIKYIKSMMMETKTLLDFGAFACFINKDLMQRPLLQKWGVVQ